MARTKKKQYEEVTLDAAQEAGEHFASINNRLKTIEAKMNSEIDKVKSKYADQITLLQEATEEHVEMLEAYAQQQKESWGKRKSFELLHCTIGFRTATPKVTKDKKFTWDAVTELVKKLFPNLVRTKFELDKESIIALREAEDFKALQTACYIDVVQEENFFIEPKEEVLV